MCVGGLSSLWLDLYLLDLNICRWKQSDELEKERLCMSLMSAVPLLFHVIKWHDGMIRYFQIT